MYTYMYIGSGILKMLVVAGASDCQIKKKRSPFLSGLLQVRTLQALKDVCFCKLDAHVPVSCVCVRAPIRALV